MVKIYINNVYSKIVGHLPEQVYADLNKSLSYKAQNLQYITSVKEGRWDGVFRLFQKSQGQSFYTGLLAYVRDIFEKHNIQHQRIDQRIIPQQNLPNLKFIPPPQYEKRDYQELTIDRSIDFTRGILSMATGGGKTMTVTELIARIKTAPAIFYVLTKDLMLQAHNVLSSCLNEPIGMIGDGKCDIRNINVCTNQTAIRAINSSNKNFKINDYKFDDEDVGWNEKGIESENKAEQIRHMIDHAKFVYFDECHHVSSKTAKEVITASKNAYWRFGGSATPYRETGDEIMIQAMFGAKIVQISASYLIKRGFLNKPHILVVPVDTHCPYKSYPKVYSHCVTENDVFNDHVADTAKHMTSRGLNDLILVQRYKQGDYLKKQLDGVEFVTGKMTTKKRDKCIQDLRDENVNLMIATTLADEGLDIPALNAAQMAGLGKSATRLNQRVGRVIRKDPNSSCNIAVFVLYWFRGVKHLDDHLIQAVKILKREKEFEFIYSKGTDFVNEEIDQILGISSGTDLFSA